MPATIRTGGNVALMTVQGNLCHHDTQDLDDKVDEVIDAGFPNVVMSLKQARFLASAGIRLFVRSHDRTKAAGGRLMLAGVPASMRYMLEAAELKDFFDTASDDDDAMARLGAPLAALRDGLPTRSERQHPHGGSSAAVEPGKHETSMMDDAMILRLLRRFLPRRTAVEVVDYFVGRGHDVADVSTVARVLGRPQREIARTMRELSRLDVLKRIGDGATYNYSPPAEARGKIRQFLSRWHTSTEHNHLLALVMKIEH